MVWSRGTWRIALSAGLALFAGGGCKQPADATTRPPAMLSAAHASDGPTAGMWLPNALPVDRLQRLFDFAPTPEWAEHLQLSSVRIGASGAFVSTDGLVLTNHHVAAGGLHNISAPGKDYIANGFLAKTRADEARLPGMELSILESIEDVTGRINAAVDPKLSAADAVKARHAIEADIERESLEKTGFQSRVVTLYGGALRHLYRYKRYSDIRAVFAPEVAIAFFGGDPDNFEYPRYDLDIILLRAYENGHPAHIKHFLRFSANGAAEGEPVFVSGHPGHTDRLLPVAVLETMRDQTLPFRIEQMERIEKTLQDYAARNPETARQAEHEIFSIQNGLKATRPRLAALREGIIERKQKEEATLRSELRSRVDLRAFDAAFDRLATAQREHRRLYLQHAFLEEGRAFGTRLFRDARLLVRLAAEDAKPDSARLPEFTQSKRDSLEHGLFANDPIYPDLEIVKLTESLRFFREKLGAADPAVQKVLADQTLESLAKELVTGSKLGSAAERRRIRAGGSAAIASSSDPMIRLAFLVDDDARRVRQEFEATVQEPETEALTEINRARFALFGTTAYPDATGTLRLAYGVVKGYEQDGRPIPAWTTLGGAFEHQRRHAAVSPYALPESWSRAMDAMNLRTPFNFVCTADITGGNSGSPVVNRTGELVGVIFDSNRQGVADNFTYSDEQARAVAVDSRAIMEALSKIYGADALVAELRGKSLSGR